MKRPGSPSLIAAALLLGTGTLAVAQTAPGVATPTSSNDRLFLAFAEEATVVERQWWEGQVGTADADAVDGSGATDLDLWGKYHLGGSETMEWAVGGMLTVPTGDETAGLGNDAFGASGFGSMRYRMKRMILAGQAGLRFNGDGKNATDVNEREGETSPMVGAGLIFPFSDQLAGVAEARYEDGHLEGDDADTRALGGINWRAGGRGMLRAAIAFGLSDGAPDSELLVGYAAQF
jgi:hypothetical protein